MARLAGPYGRGTGFPAGLLFPYQLRKSDGCNLLKTKLEFASSSKADGPLGRAIRKRNWLPGRIAFAYQLRKSDGCNLLKTKLAFASSSKADGPLAGPYRRGTWHEAGVRRSATPSAKSDSRPNCNVKPNHAATNWCQLKKSLPRKALDRKGQG